MLSATLAILLTAQGANIVGTVTDGGKPVKDAIVWLPSVGKSKPVKAAVIQKDKRFSPRISVVPLDSTVTFPNRDDIFHNVFAEYNAKNFDLGMYPKGQTRDVVFNRTGLVSVLCNVHAGMNAYIMVVDSAYFTKTDGKGLFKLSNVPAGKITIEAWHESGKVASESVRLGTDELKVNLQLTRKR